MTTKKMGGRDNGFAFESKKEIGARIATDDAFVVKCLGVLDTRQTPDEAERRETKWKNRRGWSSSHARKGSELAAKVADGLSAEELGKARELCSHYTTQLAQYFREAAIEENSDLAKAHEAFFRNN